MTTFIQAHYLTVYGPSNLNRDDTGRPKTANFGGSLRLRVSSQSLKRSWRTSASFQSYFNGTLGHRTRLIGEEILPRLTAAGMSEEAAAKTVRDLIKQFGKPEEGKRKDGRENVGLRQLYFISPTEMKALEAVADRLATGEKLEEKETGVITSVMSAPDIAMFGRMVADAPAFNIEAAVQVSHAITTHRAVVDEDAYTAVDDLNTGMEDAGAGFMGVFEFGSGVFYSYICIDRDQLVRNLQGNEPLADQSIAILLESAATEGPTAKRASFAHQSRAGYVLLERGPQQPRNLAYAFLNPVNGDQDYMVGSISKLQEFRKKTDDVYGPCADETYEIDLLKGVGSISGMREWLSGGVGETV